MKVACLSAMCLLAMFTGSLPAGSCLKVIFASHEGCCGSAQADQPPCCKGCKEKESPGNFSPAKKSGMCAFVPAQLNSAESTPLLIVTPVEPVAPQEYAKLLADLAASVVADDLAPPGATGPCPLFVRHLSILI
jgi:hypothetical protein